MRKYRRREIKGLIRFLDRHDNPIHARIIDIRNNIMKIFINKTSLPENIHRLQFQIPNYPDIFGNTQIVYLELTKSLTNESGHLFGIKLFDINQIDLKRICNYVYQNKYLEAKILN